MRIFLSFVMLSVMQVDGASVVAPLTEAPAVDPSRRNPEARLTDAQAKAFMMAAKTLAEGTAAGRAAKANPKNPDKQLSGDSAKFAADTRDNSKFRLTEYARVFFGEARFDGLVNQGKRNGNLLTIEKAKRSCESVRAGALQACVAQIERWMTVGNTIQASTAATNEQIMKGLRAYMRAYILSRNIEKICDPAHAPIDLPALASSTSITATSVTAAP